MPVTDGIELLKQARARRASTCTFIMVTGVRLGRLGDRRHQGGRLGLHHQAGAATRRSCTGWSRSRRCAACARRTRRCGSWCSRSRDQPFKFTSPSMRGRRPADQPRRADRQHGADHRRERHRQGRDRAAASTNCRRARDGPFVPVNCGAIPENLIESEFFGHTKGAFTSADRARKGLFLQADSGTIFLDEIGELPLPMQTKLLHVIEDKEVRPLGSEAVPQGRHAHHRRDQPRPDADGGRRAVSARTCTSGSRCSRSACRPCASGGPTFADWCGT